MKQSAKIFERMNKNQPNLKDRVAHDDLKITELKQKVSEQSEDASSQNEDDPENSGFSRPKSFPYVHSNTKPSNSSWFTKVNQILSNGGAKIQNKENREANKNGDGDYDTNLDHTPADDDEDSSKVVMEKRIARFMSRLTRQLK